MEHFKSLIFFYVIPAILVYILMTIKDDSVSKVAFIPIFNLVLVIFLLCYILYAFCFDRPELYKECKSISCTLTGKYSDSFHLLIISLPVIAFLALFWI